MLLGIFQLQLHGTLFPVEAPYELEGAVSKINDYLLKPHILSSRVENVDVYIVKPTALISVIYE